MSEYSNRVNGDGNKSIAGENNNIEFTSSLQLKNKIGGGVICGIFSIIISIVALMISIFRAEPIVIDFAGFTVASLSVLVVMLISWQIFNVITFESTLKKKMEEVLKEAKKEIEIQKIETEGKIFNAMSLNLLESGDCAASFTCGINAIYCYLKTGNSLGIQTTINNLKIIITKMKKTNIGFGVITDMNEQNRFIKTLTDTKNVDTHDIIAFIKEKM